MLEGPSRVNSGSVAQQEEQSPREQTLEELAETELSPENVRNFIELGIKLEKFAELERSFCLMHGEHRAGSHFFRMAFRKYYEIKKNISQATDGSTSESASVVLYDRAIEKELTELWGRNYHQEFNKFGLFHTIKNTLTQMLSEKNR